MKFVTRISDHMPYLLQDSPLDPALWLFVLPFVGTAAAVVVFANLI